MPIPEPSATNCVCVGIYEKPILIFFPFSGQLLASGSDDTNVVLWDWARNKPLSTIKTGHKSNVFQSKFLFLNAKSQVNIVTCARDGQVRQSLVLFTSLFLNNLIYYCYLRVKDLRFRGLGK